MPPSKMAPLTPPRPPLRAGGGGGVGCRVEMCVINLPTPKIGQLLQMGGGGGIPTSSPLLQCCGECLSPVWSLLLFHLSKFFTQFLS
jgi:hypothetical protein